MVKNNRKGTVPDRKVLLYLAIECFVVVACTIAFLVSI